MKQCITYAMLLSAITLTACQKKSDLPPPTKPERINYSAINKELRQIENRLKAKITEPDNQTIYYFSEEQDENGKPFVTLTINKEKAKYYRKIFGRTVNGECIFQGFYVENDYPQCSVAIASKEECNRWNVNIKQHDDAIYAWYNVNINSLFDHIVKIEQGKNTDIFYSLGGIWKKLYSNDNQLILDITQKNSETTFRCEYGQNNKTLKKFYIFNNRPITEPDDEILMYAFINNQLDLDHSVIWHNQQGYKRSKLFFKKDIIQEIEQFAKQTCFINS